MPKRKFARSIIGFSAVLLTAASYGFDIDTDKYFGYYKIPDRFQGGVSIYSPYILLSQDKCEAAGKYTAKAKKGLSYWPGTERTRHECWAELSDGDTETANLGNACVDISKTRFMDTNSLPSHAGF